MSEAKLNYLFRKSPIVRVLIALSVIVIILGSVLIYNYKTRPIPYIDAIVPPVGQPGDVVVISGRNFGNERDMNYVEFSGSKLTSSSYISWSDTMIKVVIPANIQDSLVVVCSGKLRSKPAFFANAFGIPIEVKEKAVSSEPIITSILNNKASIGELVTIYGNNFGDSRNQSRVYFSIDYDIPAANTEYKNLAVFNEKMIPASDDDYCYEYWSNSEIRVRIPDGACSGAVFVDTPAGKSEPYEISIDSNIGQKTFTDRKVYLLQYSVDVAEVVPGDLATITLRCPIPVVDAGQNSVQMTEITPEPILENYQKTLIHQLVAEKNILEKRYFRQTFLLPVYAISTKVNVERIPTKNSPMPDVLYAVATRQDELIPSGDEGIKKLAAVICKNEKNPYKKAKLIYDYMISKYEVSETYRKSDANPLDLLESKKGDCYDFAIVYTSLLRAADIPAFADCGILVSPDFMTRNHAWAEFYISGIGWIPVDVALGAGMKYKRWDEDIDVASFYFGNLDAYHIKFSRGINTLKPFSQGSKIIQRPRSFAFQSFWEEASNDTVKYSSFWSDPVIKGLY